MWRILWILPILAFPTPGARAEMMLTSYYRAKAPHIAAHRTLPIGTWLIIANPRNGRSTCVVIGVRGPFIRGRHLDISHEFAKNLDFEKSGVLWLETRVVGADSHTDPHPTHRDEGPND